MSTMASQITSLTTIYPIVHSGADQRKPQKLRVTGLCAGNSPATGEFPAQKASNAENFSIWWRHHVWGRVSTTFTISVLTNFRKWKYIAMSHEMNSERQGLIIWEFLGAKPILIFQWRHMSVMVSQISGNFTTNCLICSIACSCNDKRNIKAPYHWHFVTGIHRWQVRQ